MSQREETVAGVIGKAAKSGEAVVKDMGRQVERAVDPIRKNAFRRFPVLFTLLIAFGVAAVFFGFEQLLLQSGFLSSNPVLPLILGVVILYFTGKLYKKLS